MGSKVYDSNEENKPASTPEMAPVKPESVATPDTVANTTPAASPEETLSGPGQLVAKQVD